MSNKVILFADDSATMRTIMEKTFAAEPYDVISVPSGEMAVVKAREMSPSVVIADAGMVGVSGYDVHRKMKEDDATSDIPVIIMAGVSSPYDENRGREAGVKEFMKKPFDTTQLIAKVNQLAGATAQHAPAPATEARPAQKAAVPAAEARPAPVATAVQSSKPLPSLGDAPTIADTQAGLANPSSPAQASFSPQATSKRTPKKTLEFGASTGKPEPVKPEPVKPEPAKPAMPMAKEAPPIATVRPAMNEEPEEVQTVSVRASAVELTLDEPELPTPEPIDEPAAPAEEADFQVGTLAELAQMDEQGDQIPMEPAEDAIDLTVPRQRAPADEVDEPLPVVELVDDDSEDESAAVTAEPLPIAEPLEEIPLTAPIASPTVKKAAAAAAREVVDQVAGLSPAQAEAITQLTSDVIEQVVWEVVPDLAETIIREEIAKLLEE